MVNEDEPPRGRRGGWHATTRRAAAAGLIAAALVCVWTAGFERSGELGAVRGRVELDVPAEVKELEREASKDVEDDATKAGLKALGSRNSLVATLTGGLKRKLKNMQLGDNALMGIITSKIAGKHASPGAAAAPTETAHGKRGRNATLTEQAMASNVGAVEAAVQRDRKVEMHRMATVLAKVKLLKKEVQLREKKRKAGGSDKLGAAGDKRAAHIATANALLTEAKKLEAKARTIRQLARRRYVPDYKNLEQAETKQQVVIDQYKHIAALANGEATAREMEVRAKRLSQRAIQGLKQAGREIKQSHVPHTGKGLPLHQRVLLDKSRDKKAARLQKASESATEKAVHEGAETLSAARGLQMLVSKKLGKQASRLIHEAGKASAELPALEKKARQAKLVMKVLEVQQRKAEAAARSDPAFEAKMGHNKRLLAAAAQDRLDAKKLRERAERGGLRRAAKAEQDIIKSDESVAGTLAKLRQELDREKRYVVSDDAILSALGP